MVLGFFFKLNFQVSLNLVYNQMSLKKSMLVCGLQLNASYKCLNCHIKSFQGMDLLPACSWHVFKSVLCRGEICGRYQHKSHIASLNTLKFKIQTGIFRVQTLKFSFRPKNALLE